MPSSSETSLSDESDTAVGQKRNDHVDASEDKVVEKSPKGRFHRFNRKLGSGSYKTVYLAFDNDTGREVAWNVISFAHLNRSERKRIDAEIQIAKSLDHPRILKFVSAWINKEKEEVVFITERVSGGSLRAYICRLDGPLKLKVIKNWCRQILEGLCYLHTQPNPVIHRDLKCDNIFINGNDGKVLIGDLGLSTSLRGGAAACATSIVGTPEFMAPELYEEKYGPPVDIYAFGMCLLEMVSRRYPYSECTTPGQIYKKVISSEKPQVLSRVKDDELRHIIEVCLDTVPENRPTAEELLNDPFWVQVADETGGNKLAEIIEDPSQEFDAEGAGAAIVNGGMNHPVKLVVDKAAGPTPHLAPPAVNRPPSPPPPKKSMTSIVYHEEVKQRMSKNTTTSADTTPGMQKPLEPLPVSGGASAHHHPRLSSTAAILPHLPHNVVPGPTDDTLILLSSPKASNEDYHEGWNNLVKPTSTQAAASASESTIAYNDDGVLTYCRRNRIDKVEKVHLILEITEGKFHNVIFDFNALTDHPQIIATELRDAGLVWEGVSRDELVSLVAKSIVDRIEEANAEVISSLSGGAAAVVQSNTSMTTNAVVTNPVVTKIPALDLLSEPAAAAVSKPQVVSPRNMPMAARVESTSPLPSVRLPTVTVDSQQLHPPVVSKYVHLSREDCAHLQQLYSSQSTGSADESSASMYPPRTGSVSNSMDESGGGSMGAMSSVGAVALVPPLNVPVGRVPTSEDVKTLQSMLLVALPGDKMRKTSFVSGVYCAFTQDTVRDLQNHNGMEVTGEVDDKTWELLMEQISVRRKKEEEKAQKREEAARKAKIEQEKKLAQQKADSARAMDNMMEKTLFLIGGQPGATTTTVPAIPSPGGPSAGNYFPLTKKSSQVNLGATTLKPGSPTSTAQQWPNMDNVVSNFP